MAETAPVLIGGQWRQSSGTETFEAVAPETQAVLGSYPVSDWSEVDEALEKGWQAYRAAADVPPETFAAFLERYADLMDGAATELAQTAHDETALPVEPRLLLVELPRTTDQLRQAAAAARSRVWTSPTLSPTAGIASSYAPIPGVVAVFGPNNFPFAFNSAAGGDFAAAVATGHPVVAKANPGHPGTTRLLAELGQEAASAVGLPDGFLQLLYRTSHEDGSRIVADRRVAATAYTGSRTAGLALKSAADQAGIPIYLEMSSINPVLVLPGALRERGASIASELGDSALNAVGQFCTSPGLLVVPEGEDGDAFVDALCRHVADAPSGTLLGPGVREGLEDARALWERSGARLIAEADVEASPCRHPNTVMTVGHNSFLASPEDLQSEAFGNMTLIVRVPDADGFRSVLAQLEGNLTGTIYSARDGSDDALHDVLAPLLAERVGRLLSDKVPTGVAVVAAMNHGGPYPSTGHPGFTAVGIPASLRRFGALRSYDAVRADRLPIELRPENPLRLQRFIDGRWTDDAVEWPVPAPHGPS